MQAEEVLGGLQRRVDREVSKGMDTLSQAEAHLQVTWPRHLCYAMPWLCCYAKMCCNALHCTMQEAAVLS